MEVESALLLVEALVRLWSERDREKSKRKVVSVAF